jgi:hypothetical protein
MQHPRVSAALAALVAIVCVITMAGPTAAGPVSAGPVSAADPGCPSNAPFATAGPNRPPPRNAPMTTGAHFSFPNRSSAERMAIRNRVLNTIKSTWGWYYVPVGGCFQRKRGTIRLTTWSFNDWGVRDALVAAADRGTKVQIIASAGVNRRENYKPWKSLKAALNSAARRRAPRYNFARECSGACRGSGGTSHTKYFLFEDVGRSHQVRNIVAQSSMNLTKFAYQGQWNQATAMRDRNDVFNRFRGIFNQAASHGRTGRGYRRYVTGNVVNIFFPKGRAADPVLALLNRVRCAGGTRVRVIQYAIHSNRGNAIAKKLRSLWNNRCDVRIIYSISSRPVLGILRSRAGRGPIPMRQSVIKNRRGEIVKYNHSKWLAIAGSIGPKIQAGSANWSDLANVSDEQMQEVNGSGITGQHFANFNKTWRQSTSRVPRFGRVAGESLADVPVQPHWGEGELRYLSEWG